MEKNVFNGIDFTTADYLAPRISVPELTQWARAQRRDLKEERDLRWAHERDFRNRPPDRRPAMDVDPLDLASSGWGVIFPQDTPRAVRDALGPLLDLRKEQAGKYYQERDYVPGESKDSFFRRYEVEAGPAHPEQLAYYLLIVGGPEIVPHRFQYQLDMQYAVGRLCFDEPADYRRYAESVVAAEAGQHHVRPEACFFSVLTPNDAATKISTNRFVQPLEQTLQGDRSEWKLRSLIGDGATKAALRRLLGGDETPALLLTAAHGLAFRGDHPRQRSEQGAIICQDWPGLRKRILREHYLAAEDIGDDARVHGLVAFLFGCHSAGVPNKDNFPPGRWGQPKLAPDKPFISALARRLLSHPNGSALAVVGHIDRAWTTSFGSRQGNKGILYIESFFKQLLDGYPVGLAMDWINERFAELSTDLTDVLDKYKDHDYTDPQPENVFPVSEQERMVDLWRANNDARNFVVLGDPAVRLAAGPKAMENPVALELRARAGWSSLPVHSIRKRHIEAWLTELGTRDNVDLGVEPATAVRALRGREEESHEVLSRGEVAPDFDSRTKLVVDASAVLALLLQPKAAGSIAERLRKAEGNIHAPHLLDVEIVELLRRHAAAHPDQEGRCRQAILDLRKMPVFRYSHDVLADRSWEMRESFSTSEASYLALAEYLSARLLTCDVRLVAHGHNATVELLSAKGC